MRWDGPELPAVLVRTGLRLLATLGLVALTLLPHRQFWTPFAVMLVAPAALALWRGHPAGARPWLAFIGTFLAYVYLRRYADELGPGPFARYVIEWERLLFGGIPTLGLQRHYTPGTIRWWDLAAIGFHLSHFFGAPIVAIGLWRLRSPRLHRWLLAMSAMYLAAAAIHLALPTLPPWLAGQTGHLPTVYLPQSDILDHWTPGLYGATLQTGGGNLVAAMPSVHAATAAGIALALPGPWAAAGWLYLAGMAVSLVYLGHHYAVDVLAGNLLMILCWRAVERRALYRR